MDAGQQIYNILIVDDSQAVREGLLWLLQDETNLRVIAQAATAAEAVQLAIKLKPDLVILDIELPDMDGFAVTQLLKALPQPPVVILLSIHSDPASRQRGTLAGCDAYVEKGTSWSNFMEVLHETLKITK